MRLPTSLLLLLLLAAFAFAAPGARAETFAYPTSADADFLVDVPDDWEVEPAEEAGGFVNISGPTGVLVSLRSVEADEYTTDDVIAEASEFLRENYTDVQLAPVQRDANGMLILAGFGKNEGDDVIFSNVFFAHGEEF